LFFIVVNTVNGSGHIAFGLEDGGDGGDVFDAGFAVSEGGGEAEVFLEECGVFVY
jgi:hypothetical protein